MCLTPENRRQQIVDEEHEIAALSLVALVDRLDREHTRAIWESPEDLFDQPFHVLARMNRLITELKKRVNGAA